MLSAADNDAGSRLGAEFSRLLPPGGAGLLARRFPQRQVRSLLKANAPRTFAWLCAIRDGKHLSGARASAAVAPLEATDALKPLLAVIGETFVPLMRQNEAAYVDALAQGETLFNESAFNRGRALYRGELRGVPFRHVVKTFQVRTWRDLRSRWQHLASDERQGVEQLIPGLEHAFG